MEGICKRFVLICCLGASAIVFYNRRSIKGWDIKEWSISFFFLRKSHSQHYLQNNTEHIHSYYKVFDLSILLHALEKDRRHALQDNRVITVLLGLNGRDSSRMATNMDVDIQELSFTVRIDMQAINNRVGPLVLSTTKLYRERRHDQPVFIARRINLGRRAIDYGEGAIGNFGRLVVEVLYMIFDNMDIQTFLKMKRVCKYTKARTDHQSYIFGI